MLRAICLICGMLLAFGTGANDAANSMGAAVGAGVRTRLQACMLVSVFGLLGVLFGGAPVAGTTGKGVVTLHGYAGNSATVLVAAALTASGLWVNLTTRMGLPTSTSHSLVSAMAGAGLAMDPSSVNWLRLLPISLSWIAAPLLAGAGSFMALTILRPYKGRERHFRNIISWLLTLSGILMAYSWGAAGLGNIAGPIALGTSMSMKGAMLLMGISAGAGVLIWGRRVMATVGEEITPLTPLTAFACETSSACAVFVSSIMGLPISSSHAIVGALMGMRYFRRLGHEPSQDRIILKILISWALTPLSCVLLGGICCLAISGLS